MTFRLVPLAAGTVAVTGGVFTFRVVEAGRAVVAGAAVSGFFGAAAAPDGVSTPLVTDLVVDRVVVVRVVVSRTVFVS